MVSEGPWVGWTVVGWREDGGVARLWMARDGEGLVDRAASSERGVHAEEPERRVCGVSDG